MGNDQCGAVWQKLELGVCYYPEHWEESFWAEDLRRMKEVGLNTIRIAEFAWNKFEPEESVFTFNFFDHFMEYVELADMKVIFCTPTATPPAWLTHKYPECLNADIQGHLFRHGARRHYNYNSPKYQELCARIVEKLGEHYGKHPNIVGWQIDNELNCEVENFYSESDHLAFREFLKKKYETLDKLNYAWGTDFWNQTYTDWEEVHAPRPTIHDTCNPHQKLDYITTNGLFGHMDNVKMAEESLDTYMYDSYPNFAFGLAADPVHSNDLNDRKWSRNLTETRAVSRHFGVMEQQSGPGGWNNRMEAPSPKPGQLMLWTMQSIAHGADYVSYFRWRTCRISTEIYWHGILNYDSRDNRRLDEVRKVAARVRNMEEIAGADFVASFGLVKSYDNQWDGEKDVDVWHERVQKFSEQEIFCGAQLSHTPYDVVYLGENQTAEILTPERYPFLIYPHGTIVTAADKVILEKYVHDGGILCLGCRTGYKNEHGHCITEPMPGPLREIAGGTVTDFTWIRPEEKVHMTWRGTTFDMPVFNDILETESGSVAAVFENNYYAGKPAVLENSYGKGKVLYVGGVFTRELTREILEYAGVLHPFANLADVPETCEVEVRKNRNRQYLFVLNYMPYAQQITLCKEMQDVDSGETVKGNVELEPYGTRVYVLTA